MTHHVPCPLSLRARTLTQEDPGDNQISLEEVIRLVSLIHMFVVLIIYMVKPGSAQRSRWLMTILTGCHAVCPQAEGGKAEPFENLSALEIAEQLTLLDHLVFKVIPYE